MDVASIDLASVDHVLSTTRAVRKRLDLQRPVEPEILECCIEIATQAPTGLYGETWQFVVVTEPEKRAALAALVKKTADGIFSGTLSPDPYLARLHMVSAEDPRFARATADVCFWVVPHQSPTRGAGAGARVYRRAGRDRWPGGASLALRLDHAGDVVLDAGAARSRSRLRPDYWTYRTLRARDSRDP